MSAVSLLELAPPNEESASSQRRVVMRWRDRVIQQLGNWVKMLYYKANFQIQARLRVLE